MIKLCKSTKPSIIGVTGSWKPKKTCDQRILDIFYIFIKQNLPRVKFFASTNVSTSLLRI